MIASTQTCDAFRPEVADLARRKRPVHLLLSATLRTSKAFALYAEVLRANATDADFLPFECLAHERDRMRSLFTALRDNGPLTTVVVSDPFKTAAAACADELRPRARAAGEANVLYRRFGKVIGDNLDGVAFNAGLGEINHQSLAGSSVMFFGCGGVSTAVSLANVGAVRSIGLCDPDNARATALRDRLKLARPTLGVRIIPATGDRRLNEYDVLYNGSGLGQGDLEGYTPLFDTDVVGADRFIDAIYAPAATAFLEQGRAQGARITNGLSHMLASSALHCSMICDRTVSVSELMRAYTKLEGLSQGDVSGMNVPLRRSIAS